MYSARRVSLANRWYVSFPARVTIVGCWLIGLAAAWGILMASSTARGQLFLETSAERRLPRPPVGPSPRPLPPTLPPASTYKIKEMSVEAHVDDSVAQVQVGQTFVNTGSTTMQVQFVFPLPYDGAVSQLTFLVDGKEYEGKLLDAKQAREIFQGYVRRNQDPALMEWVGWGMYQTSVFPVPPGAARTVTLKYSQVCRQQHGVNEFLFPLTTAKYTAESIGEVRVSVHLQSDQPLGNIYSPTCDVQIERPSDRRALVKYSITNSVPQHDYRLFWDVGQDAMRARLLSYRANDGDEGYFLLLLRPGKLANTDAIEKKTVVFAVDRSGSMNGKKMEQARNALKFVLNNLRPGDLFNIIAYDSEVAQFRPELQAYGPEIQDVALGFVEGLHAGGSTNIDGALTAALAQVQPESGPAYVVFLTDGLPTVGEQNETRIVAQALKNNRAHARIFTFGVGYDVNSRLLDKLSRDNQGQSEYVRPDEDLEGAVSRFYDRIGAPILTNVSFDFSGIVASERAAVNRLYPSEVRDLFLGEQIVMVGRYPTSGTGKLIVRGTGRQGPETYDFPFTFAEPSADGSSAFVGRLWAARRIGTIIDQIDLEGQNQELVDELVALSKKHGILTPYTSFLADDQQQFLSGPVNESREARNRLSQLEESSGERGFVQRRYKGSLQRALSTSSLPQAAPATAGQPFDALSLRDAEPRAEQPEIRVLQVGAKTFYRRGDRWVEEGITPEDEKQAIAVERFSDDYFQLVDKFGASNSIYLGIDGPVMLRWDGAIYAF